MVNVPLAVDLGFQQTGEDTGIGSGRGKGSLQVAAEMSFPFGIVQLGCKMQGLGRQQVMIK